MENRKPTNLKGLTREEIVRIAAEEGTRAGIAAWQRSEAQYKKETNDRRLHNTKMLLRSYRKLKIHTDNAVYDVGSALQEPRSPSDSEDERDTMQGLWDCLNAGYDDLYIESILRSKARTQTMVSHIDRMLDLYEENCKKFSKTEDLRRFNVVKALFIDPMPKSAADIATANYIDSRTVYKWVDFICGDLSALIFGLGGIRM